MGLYILGAVISLLVLSVAVLFVRRFELTRMSKRLDDLATAKSSGSHTARLQYPHIDLTRCIGCSACVSACPEDGVLGMIHGQAAVIYGARCVGHGRCATACPVGAISLTLADLEDRRDLPAITENFEVIGAPGLYLAGEVTGYALIRTAITQGTAIVDRIADLLEPSKARRPAARAVERLDLVIVGAGPAGLAASLQAKKRGLKFVTLEQEELGGTVSKYPRRKLVMTQPVTLPLYGTLKRSTYSKEELMSLWDAIAKQHQLPVQTGQQFTGLRPIAGGYEVSTQSSTFQSQTVCLALGRRGTPVKLAVPGEELPKVAYGLTDAQSFQNRRIVVVGGGDSAIEAALGLSAQPGNQVTLSYRKEAFFRLKARNETELRRALNNRQLECLLNSQIKSISENSVSISINDRSGTTIRELPNDEVFVLAGGIPPFKLLADCGVSFDPADRSTPPPIVDQGTGLFAALAFALVFACGLLGWTWWFRGYYQIPAEARAFSPWHSLLRPSGPVGLCCGIIAAALIIANLCYLLRRNWLRNILPGQLARWMTAHIATGILALLFVLVHSAFAPKNTIGGHALVTLTVLVVTGAIGRYFYAFLPRAANGKELELGEIQSIVAADLARWDAVGRDYQERVYQEIQDLVANCRWNGKFLDRAFGLAQTRATARAKIRELKRDGLASGLTPSQVDQIAVLASRAYRTAIGTSHFEDLRALLNSWRYLHRWIALAMVALTIAHVVLAARYSNLRP